MSDQRQAILNPVFERSPVLITLQLTDQADAPLAKVQLETVTLTLYDKRVPGEFINERDEQNVLDANGGTVSTDGVLTLVLGEDDQVLTSQGHRKEDHVVLLKWTWIAGPGPGIKEITYPLINQVQVT